MITLCSRDPSAMSLWRARMYSSSSLLEDEEPDCAREFACPAGLQDQRASLSAHTSFGHSIVEIGDSVTRLCPLYCVHTGKMLPSPLIDGNVPAVHFAGA